MWDLSEFRTEENPIDMVGALEADLSLYFSTVFFVCDWVIAWHLHFVKHIPNFLMKLSKDYLCIPLTPWQIVSTSCLIVLKVLMKKWEFTFKMGVYRFILTTIQFILEFFVVDMIHSQNWFILKDPTDCTKSIQDIFI